MVFKLDNMTNSIKVRPFESRIKDTFQEQCLKAIRDYRICKEMVTDNDTWKTEGRITISEPDLFGP